MRFKYLLLGFAIGNFLVQWITVQDWGTAAERTFFQALALITAWFMNRK